MQSPRGIRSASHIAASLTLLLAVVCGNIHHHKLTAQGLRHEGPTESQPGGEEGDLDPFDQDDAVDEPPFARLKRVQRQDV